MRTVQTAKGLIPEDQLEVKDIRADGENDISLAREWYHQGELVRRDAWVTVLRGHTLTAEGNL